MNTRMKNGELNGDHLRGVTFASIAIPPETRRIQVHSCLCFRLHSLSSSFLVFLPGPHRIARNLDLDYRPSSSSIDLDSEASATSADMDQTPGLASSGHEGAVQGVSDESSSCEAAADYLEEHGHSS